MQRRTFLLCIYIQNTQVKYNGFLFSDMSDVLDKKKETLQKCYRGNNKKEKDIEYLLVHLTVYR